MKLAIHTVFNLRENILFLEDWITYHKLIGFDFFFLYDNSKSIGTDGRTNSKNKYKIDFAKATSHINDFQLNDIFHSIQRKFNDEITYILWEPKDSLGNVIYFQNGSITHYVRNFSSLSDWTAFIDMDEYIYCKTDLKRNIYRIKKTTNANNILMFQKKFDDRFNNIDKSVLEITACINNIDTTKWVPKTICNNTTLRLYNQNKHWDIHSMLLDDTISYFCDPQEFRFNHYNINPYQLEWMKLFYQTDQNFTLNGTCNELLNRTKILKQQ